MMKNNCEIRTELLRVGMKQYELAELLGITEFTLSRKLRKELPDDEKQRILEIIAKAR
jgi:predicted transcriptional regulator